MSEFLIRNYDFCSLQGIGPDHSPSQSNLPPLIFVLALDMTGFCLEVCKVLRVSC